MSEKVCIVTGVGPDKGTGAEIAKLFGKKNIFLASPEETFMLTSNVLVISPEIIVSHSKFKRLNKWLEEKGVLVEKVDYSNVSKMSGLFRCSTLPLEREL